MPLLADHLPSYPHARPSDGIASADSIVEAFTRAQEETGRTLYDHQAEALLALASGDHVIAATPTGSGKSTVGYAALFTALATGRRAFYTAPIKALVSEKFFELVHLFGAAAVGMTTGDSSVNRDAPIIVCTAEILASHVLRDGPASDIELVVMDEFHYYGDPQRGWAWQIPLLDLPRCQFVLMSATLGDVSFLVDDLKQRTRREVSVIDNAIRPVPLDFRWSTSDIDETITQILTERDAPVYVVHFTQAAAVEQAQALRGTDMLTRDEKQRLRDLIGDFRFSKGFGSILSSLVRQGIGIHHAGMLPKYRRLVEKLAQSGLLKVICGTDTLGVGINVPIRTVLLTGLVKFDGRRKRLINSREFHQIAGRAGRAGYDTVGHVVVQAPEWTIQALKEEKRRAERTHNGSTPNSAKKHKKKAKASGPKIPEGEVNWTEKNLDKLVENPPEPLRPVMRISSSMILSVIARPGDAVLSMRHLLHDGHQTRTQIARLSRQAIQHFRGLLDADIMRILPQPDHLGRRIALVEDLQDDFTLTQPLAPFAIAALDAMEEESENLTLDSLSIIEAILDDPTPILLAQQHVAKGALLAELKEEGVEYSERMALLDEVTWPKPLEDELTAQLEVYRRAHPWVSMYDLSPKSIVREMYETGQTFSEFISRYQLARAEGVLLRYLSDAYRALSRTIPQELRTDELEDVIEWLGVLVRGIDSSLLDEWEALAHPEDEDDAASSVRSTSPRALSAQTKVLTTMVRAAMWQRVEHFAFEREERLAALDGWSGWDQARWAQAMDDYYDTYDHVSVDGSARRPELLHIERERDLWRVRQVIDDPDGNHDWALAAEVDLAATDESGELVLRMVGAGDIGSYRDMGGH
ncbi:DEAD/DEAH box helicase [Devriesea agamarum]|uniref:DEAD/DEAH box helicase n=1 Tax=Devriesea agamarum TaxID=472569 RepID=UPI0009FF2373|nr:DEAD/DEAH box helicase [Devriesea agamarum]